ncbi:MAG: dockerin type I repeat-containing protein [Phycisphaerae bacterium]|nr:dockerin type I repeat-containing protein [Phycisphaerae bacterium]
MTKTFGPGVAAEPCVALRRILLCAFVLSFCAAASYADISGQNVLVLVNSNSPTSRYIAKLYRQYHPDVPAEQVLYLPNMNNCSGPDASAADEIITRETYNQCIATPVRQFLLDVNHPERITQIMVIVTTAGMPYRIEDTSFPNVIYPAGSVANDVISHESSVDAASVESELTCLWYCDYGSNSFQKRNRMINPYQGYRASPIDLFARQPPGTKQMRWTIAISHLATLGVEHPFMEGILLPLRYGTTDRRFNAGDMYLTARLDGPKQQGQSAIFAVRKMLERAKRASNPAVGINPAQAVAVFDDAPNTALSSVFTDENRVFNIDGSANYWIYQANASQPPSAPTILIKDDYIAGFSDMTSASVDYSALNVSSMCLADDTCVMLDRRPNRRTTQQDLDDCAISDPNRIGEQLIVLLAAYGTNGDEGSSKTYLLNGGPTGEALFNLTNGAVFTSFESFNAVTMFSDAVTYQAKIVDFVSIGGSGAIGHSFEPQPDAAIDNEFLFYNLLADNDGDGAADLTFIEAAFSAIPYISWSEVVIGDPLMRIAYGAGGKAWNPVLGDINIDGIVNIKDVRDFKKAQDGSLYSTDPECFDSYNDLADLNNDGKINIKDVRILKSAM